MHLGKEMKLSFRSQLLRCKVHRLLQRGGLGGAKARLEGGLSLFPLCRELAHGALALRAQNPAPLAPVLARAGPCQTRLLDMSECPRRRRLVDADLVRQLGVRKIRSPDDPLQRGEVS